METDGRSCLAFETPSLPLAALARRKVLPHHLQNFLAPLLYALDGPTYPIANGAVLS
jgi:hypothetical protein